MKIKKGFMLRNVGGKHIVVAVGEASKSFNGLIKLNDTACFLWEKLIKGSDKDKLAKALTKEYEVDIKTAGESVDEFIKTLKEAELLDE